MIRTLTLVASCLALPSCSFFSGAEVRAGYDITPRWTINGFVGGGRAADSLSDLGSVKTQSAVGGGFRYLIARQLGMRVGIDVAEGPEGTYGYLVVGSPW